MEKSKEYLEKLKYLEEVYQIRTFIVNFMHYFKFEFVEEKVLVPKPNWDNRIKFNGAIGLLCCENGLPMSLITPWGEIKFVDIDKYNTSKQNISKNKVKQFMKTMNELFEFQQMCSTKSVCGLSCETYSIKKIPWNHEHMLMIEMEPRYSSDNEELLLDTYKEGKQLCIDIFNRETVV